MIGSARVNRPRGRRVRYKMGHYIWPKVFTDNKYVYHTGDETIACSDGLIGWAGCETGNKPPEGFGKGMVKIGKLLGISPTGENLIKYADRNIPK